MKQKLFGKFESLGFTLGHYGLIGFFVVVTIGLTFAREPLLLGNLTGLKFLQANDTTEVKSIDEVNLPPVSSTGIDNLVDEKNNLSALIDPSFSEGSVLGLSTEAEQSISHILSDDNLQTIPVNAVDVDEFSIESYVDQSTLIEDYYGSVIVLSVLSTKDSTAAAEAIPVAERIVSELKTLAVPKPLVRFHRLKLMQYGVVLNMLDTIAHNQSSKDRAAAGVLFFEITNAMESERMDLIRKYNYDL